jgi:Skp family chaperone for outer membrane proteins
VLVVARLGKADYDDALNNKKGISMMNRAIIASFFSFASLVTAPLLAHAEVRIATVDVSRIINEAPDAKAKKKELDSASEKDKELMALKTKLEEEKVSPESKEAESLRNQARDFQRMRADMKAELERKYMKINKELTDKVLGRIEAYAKANKYDLVIDKSEKMRGPVLFGSSSADITDEVLKDF